MRRAVSSAERRSDTPLVMYFHVWELDPDQPRIQAAPYLERVRQYRNLDKMPGIIRHYLQRYAFTSVSDYLGLPRRQEALDAHREAPRAREADLAIIGEDRTSGETVGRTRTPVSIVVPCFNEELILPYLANTLRSVEATLARDYEPRFIFVDDGSSDGTWESLRAIFGGRPNFVLLRHDVNRGVAAAILTGVRRARTAVVCSIDCDCTYDPHQLQSMIPMLKDDVDMVTASPYHPDGGVRNVPTWRLFLSKRLSSLYRAVLGEKLHTYTSCFRIYRKSAVERLEVREDGFLGVAEMLGLVALEGGRIAECPAVLEVRLLGRSKMRVVKTMAGHLHLLLRLGAWRLSPGRRTASPASPNESEPARSSELRTIDRPNNRSGEVQ
jgi:hypothetical protein